MNAKKTAIKGLIVIAVVVALCMFFSGTIRSIATAKVKFAQPKQGKLTQTVELKGELVFPRNDKYYIENAYGITFEVLSVKVETGAQVKKGDVLFEARVSGFEESMNQYRQSYKEAQDALTSLENKKIRLKRTDEAWAQAYTAYTAAREDALDADIMFRARLQMQGLTLEDDKLPKNADEELTALFEDRQQKQAALDEAKSGMTAAERFAVSDEVREYITDKIKQESALAEAENKMLSLQVVNEYAARVTAPDDGYITAMNVKMGEPFDGGTEAYSFCPEDEKPVIRLDTTDCTLKIAKGMETWLSSAEGGDVKLKISKVGVNLDGGQYADAPLDKRDIKDMGGTYPLMNGGVTARVEYKAKQATTLLPSSAVRGEGDERFVYVIRSEESAFGTHKSVVAKQTVTVIAESNGVVSVQEDFWNTSIAYMEDRSISDGDAVMGYDD